MIVMNFHMKRIVWTYTIPNTNFAANKLCLRLPLICDDAKPLFFPIKIMQHLNKIRKKSFFMVLVFYEFSCHIKIVPTDYSHDVIFIR